jgi:carboxymethylenebutenolidase
MHTRFPSNGRAVTLETFIPATGNQPPKPLPALLILHGSGGNTGFWLERIAPFTRHLDLALFAVHYLEATGDLRAQPAQLTDGIHVPLWLEAARQALGLIAENPAVDPARIALIGVSLGAFMSLSLGTDPANPIRAIIDVSGGLIPPWDVKATARFPPTLILHGESDAIVPVSHAHALDALLTRLDVPHETRILPGEGHFFSAQAQFELLACIAPFLAQHL